MDHSERFTIEDGVLMEYNAPQIVVPEEVREIGDEVFYRSMVSVTLPEGLERIGKWAFRWCGRLRSINIPESVKEIGKLLEEKGLIRSGDLFVWQEKFSEYSGDLKPGVYTLNTSQTPYEMMAIMSAETEPEETDKTVSASEEEEESEEESEPSEAEFELNEDGGGEGQENPEAEGQGE